MLDPLAHSALSPLLSMRFRMAWYFGMCLILNCALGVWGGINVDRDATQGLAAPQMRVTCGEINSFLVLYSTLSVYCMQTHANRRSERMNTETGRSC